MNESLVAALKARYLRALLAGDSRRAFSVIEEGLSRKLGILRVYLGILGPSLVDVGDLWFEGRVNVCHEHEATQIVLNHVALLRHRFELAPRLGLTAVIASVEGEWHELGARMVADLLYMDGWDTSFLGANTPTSDLVAFIRERSPAVVGLSVTMKKHLPRLEQAVEQLRATGPPPHVLVGGAALRDQPRIAGALPVDGIASDAMEALQEARRVVGIEHADQSLDAYLARLGQRIVNLRKAKGWNQQELANQAGINRTYISAAERGKQNLTLSIVMKLANALDVSIERLTIGLSGP